ncbi:MAG: hypothetical protein R8M38_05945 [Mariprofundaceae bacterium]
MNNVNKEQDPSEPEAVVEEAAPVTEAQHDQPNKKSHLGWVLFALALIPIIVWAVTPDTFRDRISTQLQQLGVANTDHKQAPKPPVKQAYKSQESHILTPEQLGNRQAVSTEEVELLLNTIAQLQQQMRNLQHDQKQLRLALTAEQQFILQAKLAEISQPQSHLPEIESAWLTITMLAILNPRQREIAQAAQTLSHAQIEQQKRLLQSLYAIENALTLYVQPTATQASKKQDEPYRTLTTPSDWLAWLKSRFVLKPSPTRKQIENQQLQQQIHHYTQVLITGQWPEKKDWQQLLQRIQADEQLMKLQENNGLSLPEDFDDKQRELKSIRQQARSF